MIIIKRFKYLPHILVGVLGLIIAGTSFYLLNNKYTEPVEMKDIVVTARDISMYETIRNDDLKTISVPADTDTSNYLTGHTDILGKVSKVSLSSNELIASDFLLDKDEIENITFITINTSYAKTGGAKPGDIVDVYKIATEKGDWVEGSQASLVAKDVVVISATTATGKNIGEGSKLPLGGSERVEVIRLAIKPEDIKHLAPASVTVENGYVLVVKHSYSQQENLERDPILDGILKETEENEDTVENDNELEDTESGDLEDGIIDETVPEE